MIGVFLAMGALDLARPYLGVGLRPWQWALGIVALLLLWRDYRVRGRAFRDALPVLALGAFLLPTYVDHSRNLESDGIHYYTYLRSLLLDADLDLVNDYRLLEWDYRSPNVLPIGAPLLWAPFVLVAHVVAQGARIFGAEAPSGVEPVYQGAACLATLAYGGAGLFLLQDTLRRWTSPAAAFWATVLCWVGSPLRFYLSVLPGLAHGTEFFAAVLALRAYLSLRDRPDVKRAVLAGASCGLLFLIRSQDAIVLALPGLELFLGLLRGPDRSGGVRRLLALGVAFAVAVLPQVAVWQAMFGVPILVPHTALHGEGFMRLRDPQLVGTLVSAQGGFLTSHPMMFAALVGLLCLVRRDARYVMTALPVLLIGWYVNSTVFDWYHVRRFTGLVPILAPGLAFFLEPLTRGGVVFMSLLAFLTLRYDLAIDALRSLPGDPAPMRATLTEMTDALARDGYRALEGPAPRAAVALVSSYTGTRLLDEPVTRLELGEDLALLRVPGRARNLSAIATEDGALCRWVTEREARVFLPLARVVALRLTIRAKPLETPVPQVMEAFWNEASVGRVEMGDVWADYGFDVSAETVRLGTNTLVLRFDRAPIYRRVRGEGPRQVRPAALASITLHRNP